MVKIGVRKPSIKKSIKARTTGKAKRALKRSVNPVYGKKGMGLVNNPKKAVYNKIYSKTTVDSMKLLKRSSKPSNSIKSSVKINSSSAYRASAKGVTENISRHSNAQPEISNVTSGIGCLATIGILMSITNPQLFLVTIPLVIYFYKRSEKDKKESKTRIKKEMYEESLSNAYESLLELSYELYHITKLDIFFELFEKRMDLVYFMQKEIKDNNLKDVEAIADFDESDIKTQTNSILIDFIKRFEDSAFEKAIKLKTENGRRNNYQKSLDDLMNFDSYFDAEVLSFLENHWKRF